MNTTNVVIGIGILGLVVYKMRMATPQAQGFMGLGNGNASYQRQCGLDMGPNYGNDNQGTFTDIAPVETPPQPRSVWTKDEGSWLWGWGPKKS